MAEKLLSELQNSGWHLSQEGLDLCCQGLTNPTAKDIIKKALHIDFKEIGRGCIPEDINRGKCESMPGNVVLMVTKIRNVAAPKVKEDSGAAPRMLKISLTDGIMTCHAVEVSECKGISLKTPPGTKVKLKGGKLEVANGFIKVSDKSLEVLGGQVEALIEKWRVSESLAELTRSGVTGAGGDGPPKWIPFGQKNKMPKQDPSNKHFKALGNSKEEEEKEDGEFESQRQEAIQEAVKGEQKKFGLGSKNIKDSRTKREEERAKREKSDSVEKTVEIGVRDDEDRGGGGGRGRGGRGRGKGRGRRGDREDAEAGSNTAPSKPSLFDFLQGQIPNTPAPASTKDDSKPTQERDRGQKSENFSKNDKITNGNNKDFSKDSRGGKRDYDKSKSNDHSDKNKSSNLTASKKDNDRKKDVNSDRKDNHSDKKKEEYKKKDSQTNKKNDKKDVKSDTRDSNRDSQPKEFNPVFHGKGEKNPEKLDKFEKSLFGEESKNKSFRSDNSRSKSGYQRENSRSDFSSKQQNGHHSDRRHHNDQDYGQWNGNFKRQQSNHSKDDFLSNGMQSLNLGGQAKGGHQGQPQQSRGHSDQSRGHNNDSRVTRNNSERRQGGYGDGRGQRGRGGHQRGGHHDAGQRINWQEGQRCLAKYWEDEQYYEATITGLSPTTAVVLFEAYGNYEEVLLGDLKGCPSGQSYGSNIAPTPGLPPAFRH